jgi:hypothetical protein
MDKEDLALQADNRLTQNVENLGHSTREWADGMVYYRHVKYDTGRANAAARYVSEAKTVLQ